MAGRSTEELEEELKKIIARKPKQPVKQIVKQVVKYPSKIVKQNVKQLLSADELCSELLSNKKPSEIAKKYGISRSAVTQRLKKLEALDLVEKIGKEWKVKQIVKHLALCMPPTKKKYQFQTIHITIPVKNPEIIDILKWDSIIDDVNLKIKKIPDKKLTIRKMGKQNSVIILDLHSRWVERPEQIKEICENYVDMVAGELKQYDIELDREKARANGLHLWKEDRIIKEGYDKSVGMIGVSHGVDAEKMFPSDRTVERKTWVDSTPTPDGIESNCSEYFVDKDCTEFFIGKPKIDATIERPEIELPKYMKKATDFVHAMDTVSHSFKKMDQNLDNYNRNIQLHTQVQEKQLENLKMQSGFMKEVKDMLKLQTNLTKSLSTELKVLKLEGQFKNGKREPNPDSEDIECPNCHASMSPKLLLERDFICPNCYAQLELFFPDLRSKGDETNARK